MNPVQWTYMNTWLGNRVRYLDTKFNTPCTMAIEEQSISKQRVIYIIPANQTIFITNNLDSNPIRNRFALIRTKDAYKRIASPLGTIDVSRLSEDVYLFHIKRDKTSTICEIINSR